MQFDQIQKEVYFIESGGKAFLRIGAYYQLYLVFKNGLIYDLCNYLSIYLYTHRGIYELLNVLFSKYFLFMENNLKFMTQSKITGSQTLFVTDDDLQLLLLPQPPAC